MLYLRISQLLQNRERQDVFLKICFVRSEEILPKHSAIQFNCNETKDCVINVLKPVTDTVE